jgi:hypothetical protein
MYGGGSGRFQQSNPNPATVVYRHCACCYPFFGSHKNKKIQKKYIKRNPNNNRSEKTIAGMPTNAKIG